MRWDDLFDDLESQIANELSADEVDLRAEEERLRLARLGLRDRLLSLHRSPDAAGTGIAVILRDHSRLLLAPTTFGKDWFAADILGEGRRTAACIVPLEAISALSLTRDQVAGSLESAPADDAERSLSARLGLGFVLRDLCRRRLAVEIRTLESPFFGTLDRVGRDHVDLAVHEAGGVRRESAVTDYRIVRFSEILLVRL